MSAERIEVWAHGWSFERKTDGRMVVFKPHFGSCLVGKQAKDARHIPEEILFELASDIIREMCSAHEASGDKSP